MARYRILVVAPDGQRYEYPADDADDARQVRFAATCLHPDAVVTVATVAGTRRHTASADA